MSLVFPESSSSMTSSQQSFQQQQAASFQQSSAMQQSSNFQQSSNMQQSSSSFQQSSSSFQQSSSMQQSAISSSSNQMSITWVQDFQLVLWVFQCLIRQAVFSFSLPIFSVVRWKHSNPKSPKSDWYFACYSHVRNHLKIPFIFLSYPAPINVKAEPQKGLSASLLVKITWIV